MSSKNKELIKNFIGPMCAVVTPFNNDNSLNTNKIFNYANYLYDIGVKGYFILGTTGESFTLTMDEKFKLINAWNDALEKLMALNKNFSIIIVNITSMSIQETIKLLKLVKNLKFINGVAMLEPIYYKAQNSNELIRYFQSILMDINLPFIYYHFPERTGQQNFTIEDFIENAIKNLPQFSAIKFTDSNLIRLGKIQRKFGEFIKIFVGYDEMLLAALTTLNIKSAICATFSIEQCVKHYRSMLNLIENGDLAKAQNEQNQLTQICEKLQSDGNFFSSLKQRLNDELSSTKGLCFGQVRSPVRI